MDQTHSVFMPGLTRRGPVYNALEGLPTISPGVKFAIEAGLIAAGLFKKVPLPVAIAGAFFVWKMFPDNAPITANINPASLTTIPPFDASQLQIPTVGIPTS
jgi:hypothetical protein